MREEVHVPLIRRGAVHREGAEKTSSRLLEDDTHPDCAESESSELRRELRTEYASASRLRSQFLDELWRERLRFRGDDVDSDEFRHAIAKLEKDWIDIQVHGVPPGCSSRAPQLTLNHPSS